MIIAQCEFCPTEFDRILGELLSLPKDLRPTSFADGETSRRKSLNDKAAFSEFVDQNRRIGFFLFSNSIMYDLAFRRSRCLATGYFDDSSLAKDFMNYLAKMRPYFGYSCDEHERLYKNRITVPFDENKIESWVGRDTRKWIPGLYWVTIFSEAFIDAHELDIRPLLESAIEHIEVVPREHMFQFYAEPTEWRTRAEDIARVYAAMPNTFDIKKIGAETEGARNLMELNDILSRWS